LADDLERYRAWRDSLPSSERGPIEEGEKTNVGSRDSRNRYKVKIRQKTKNVYNTTNVVYNVAGGISGQEEKKKSLWQRIKDPKTGEEAKGTFWGIVLSPFRGLAYLIKNFGVPIFAIIILVAAIFFIYRAQEVGVLQSVTNDGLVAIKRTGAPVAAKYGFFKFFDAWSNPETLADPYALETEVVDTGVNYGVEILSFESLKSTYISRNNEPVDIKMAANIKAISLPQEDLELTFDCYTLEDNGNYKGMAIPDTKTIPRGSSQDQFHDVSCSFQGYDKFKRKVESKTVIFTAKYDFTSQSRFPAYLISQEDSKNLLKLGINNPFEYYKISDPRLNGRVMKSVSPKGPVEVSIGTLKAQTQPFIEGEDNEYFIAVGLKNAYALSLGNLRSIKSIILNVPDAVELVQGNDCDFVPTGEEISIGGGRFKQYDVSTSSLAIANRDCDSLGVSASRDCVNDKQNLRFTCPFKVKELEGTDQIFYTEFAAEVQYEYEAKDLRAIAIKKEDVGLVGCDLLAEGECTTTQGCIVNYENNQFKSCGFCPAEYKVCGDYNNQNECNSNLCNLGTCMFENGLCKSI